MLSTMHQWAVDWGYPAHAIHDLLTRLGMGFEPIQKLGMDGWSEAAVQNRVRLDAAKQGTISWRNNSGAWHDPETGSFVRYGLANDTAQLNKVVKSSDLIGIKPELITPQHVGHTLGVFWARECKPVGWRYTGVGREPAQQKFGQIVIAKGGDFSFTTGAI